MLFLDLIYATPPPTSQGSAGTTILIAALGAGGFGAIIAAFVTGLFSKKKLGSEATEIITRAASGVVTSIEAELKRSEEGRVRDRGEFDRTISDLKTAHAREIETVRRVLQLHVAWDLMAIAKLSDAGIGDLPPAPPLLPPDIGSLEI
jgi:uncharacterized membrane protein YebE (DUF533 family)